MNDLLPDDRALLDLARDGHEPTGSDRTRVRQALVVQLGVGTGLATAASTSTAARTAGLAVTSVATGGVAAKVLATVVLVGAIGGGGALAYRAVKGPSAAKVAMVASPEHHSSLPQWNEPPAQTLTPLAPIATPLPERVLSPPASSTGNRGPSDPTVVRPPTDEARTVHAVPAAPTEPLNDAPPAARPLNPTTLENETRLVRAGITALHGGDPAAALALFEEHARSYPNGALAEESAAERVTALCDLGREDEARRAAAAFVREHPSSPLGPRVSAGCTASRTNP